MTLICLPPEISLPPSYKASVGALREYQGARCAMCQDEVHLVADHCHWCYRVRGMLCLGCNVREAQYNCLDATTGQLYEPDPKWAEWQMKATLYRLHCPSYVLRLDFSYSVGWESERQAFSWCAWCIGEHRQRAQVRKEIDAAVVALGRLDTWTDEVVTPNRPASVSYEQAMERLWG
jgi:hypothetical protein